MAHKVLINGTAYDTKGGRCLVNGTGYAIKKGRTLIGGTGYDIKFSNPITVTINNSSWGSIGSSGSCGSISINGTYYAMLQGAADLSVTVDSGALINVTIVRAAGNYGYQISLNGTKVASTAYSFTATTNCAISFTSIYQNGTNNYCAITTS